jgi:eukaryotic-like serine/threonine-protein kinase
VLCYRCGSHVPDTSDSCATCGQKLSGGGLRQATGTFSRRKLGASQLEGAPFEVGQLVGGRYRIREGIGAGPVGFVFRAEDQQSETLVALKVIAARLVQSADERKQFARQLNLARKLSHQNLVKVLDDGEHESHPFYTMQLLEGLSLRKIIDLRVSKGQHFAPREVEPILAQVVQALETAHKLGAHADLKPDNVIVLPDLLKVSDYGLGLALPRLPFVQAAKQRKAERYLAPEYLSGGEIDQRVDIYALGAIVGEMLCGQLPQDGEVPELHTVNPEVPAALEGLYRKAVNANPVARPKTAGELFEEFLAATRALPPPVPAPLARPRPAAAAGLQLHTRPAEKLPPPVPDEALREELPFPKLNGGLHPQKTALPLEEQTLALPSFPSAMEDEEPAEEQTQPRPMGRSHSVLWLLLLTVAGLSAGGVAGYWMLGKSRRTGQVADQAVSAVTASSSERAGSAAADTPMGGPRPASSTAEDSAEAIGRGSAAGSDEARGEDAPIESETVAHGEPEASLRFAPESVARRKESRLGGGREKPSTAGAVVTPQERRIAAVEAPAPTVPPAQEAKVVESPAPPPTGAEVVPAEPRLAEVAPAQVRVAAATAPAKLECPEGMRLVPAGKFRIGTSRDDPMMGFDEKLLATIELPAYCIDQYEYPNRRGALPLVNVAYPEAQRFCEARGRRLCTEEEWEKACKGPASLRYAYGNTFDVDACNTEDADGEDRPIAASGQFARCRSGYAAADLSGNVAEWTSTPYAGNQDRTLKGGAFDRPDYASRCSARKNAAQATRSGAVGFRCCADLGR